MVTVKCRRTALAMVAIFVIAGVALLMKGPANKQPSPSEMPPESEESAEAALPETAAPDEPVPVPTPPAVPMTSAAPVGVIARAGAPPVRAPLVANEDPNTPEGRIDQILLAEELSDADKSKRFLEMLPTFPEPLQEEVAQHMCNLMPDEAYGQLGPLLTNGITPEPILDVVMTDLLSRPNSLKLPMLLQMARNEQHPRREESQSMLEVYLEQNFGSDWAAWEKTLQAYLKENPE